MTKTGEIIFGPGTYILDAPLRLSGVHVIRGAGTDKTEILTMAKTRARTKAGKRRKVGKVMREFKGGKLKSGSGRKVRSRKQAIAIGLSEAGLSRRKR